MRDLALHTSLNPKQVRHGLALVIQHNLIFYHTDPDTGATTYEASPQASYHLVRVGKILEIIDRKYGTTAKELVNDLLMLGHVEVSELIRYRSSKQGRKSTTANGEQNHDQDHDDPFEDDSLYVNGNGANHDTEDDAKPDVDGIYNTLAQLIAAGVIETVSPTMFQSPQDLKASIEQECLKEFPNGIRGAKVSTEFDTMVRSQIKSIGAERTTTKRKLQQSASYEPSNIKRRKLANGAMSNGFAGDSGGSILMDEVCVVIFFLFCLLCHFILIFCS